ncbi:Retrovirus-related Pol polyprotein from transposon TNT 1-94 [Gossypium australe]|uniref:Retrovirus-related Pol polyprotein from transposon TNT 1-94 n=1 Tax=Gossypium australe TaxID=47621 RepID=A0A5B6VDZ7_9ROSI|nr:Retrovirus-related Pol polyprotein from transposon TNT 1-94 [Gossypium australe]
MFLLLKRIISLNYAIYNDYRRMIWVYFFHSKAATIETFKKFKGVHRELTTPYTPQQNGVAKHKNRTIVEMARSLLKSKGLPDKFWVENVVVVYLLNLSSTKTVLNQMS